MAEPSTLVRYITLARLTKQLKRHNLATSLSAQRCEYSWRIYSPLEPTALGHTAGTAPRRAKKGWPETTAAAQRYAPPAQPLRTARAPPSRRGAAPPPLIRSCRRAAAATGRAANHGQRRRSNINERRAQGARAAGTTNAARQPRRRVAAPEALAARRPGITKHPESADREIKRRAKTARAHEAFVLEGRYF